MLQKLKSQFESVLPPDFSARFHAWWEGVDYVAAPVVVSEDEAEIDGYESDEDVPVEELGNAFHRVSEGLWGEGNLAPSGTPFHEDLIEPLQLASGAQIAMLGVGLGGGARVLAADAGVSVQGFEACADYVEAADRQNAEADATDVVSVLGFDPQAVEFPEHAFDAFLSFEEIYCFGQEHRHAILAGAIKSLNEGAPLLITDFVAVEEGKTAPDRFYPPHAEATMLWTGQKYIETVQGLGVGISSQEDLTERYLEEVTKGWGNWQKVAASLKAMYTDERDVTEINHALKTLAELWAARVEVLKAGDVKLVSFLAKAET